MIIEELEKQLQDSIDNNNHEETIRLLEEKNRLLKERREVEKDPENIRKMDKSCKINSIRILETKLKTNIDKNEELVIRGRLIKELKEYKKLALPQEINSIRYRIDEELKKHKEVCKNIRVNKEKKIPITKKLGMKIKELSDCIHLFLSKHDVINKAKKVLSSTVIGGAFSIGINVVIRLLLGGGFTPASIIASLPVVAYIGISSIVRNIITKTDYQKYSYKQSDEYKELIKNIPTEYKDQLNEISRLVGEKNNATQSEKAEINKRLVELYDEIKDTTKVEEVEKYFKLEKHNLLLENKQIYESTIDSYLNESIKMPKKDYRKLVKDNLKNDIAIFESENALKEATKNAAKNLGIDLSTLLIARTIANFAIPGYKISSIKDLLVPVAYMVTNNLLGIIKYNGKIRSTKYNNKTVKINNVEKLKALAKNEAKPEVKEDLGMAMA